MRTIWVLALALVLAHAGSSAADEWVRDEDGACARVWTWTSLGRGPIALGNALTLPFRAVVGGVQEGAVGIVASPLSLLLGFGVGVPLFVNGLIETVNAGWLGVAPDEATAGLQLGSVVLLPPTSARIFDVYGPPRPCPAYEAPRGNSLTGA